MKNVNKNNAQQSIVLEAVALALALDSDPEVSVLLSICFVFDADGPAGQARHWCTAAPGDMESKLKRDAGMWILLGFHNWCRVQGNAADAK